MTHRYFFNFWELSRIKYFRECFLYTLLNCWRTSGQPNMLNSRKSHIWWMGHKVSSLVGWQWAKNVLSSHKFRVWWKDGWVTNCGVRIDASEPQILYRLPISLMFGGRMSRSPIVEFGWRATKCCVQFQCLVFGGRVGRSPSVKFGWRVSGPSFICN